MRKAAAEHKAAYEEITAAGTESIEQQKAVFMTWAEAEAKLAAATGKPISPLIEAKAAALGLTSEMAALNATLLGVDSSSTTTSDALTNLGNSAKDAGDKVASVGTATEGTVTAVSELKPLVAQISAETINLGKASEYAGMSAADLTAEIDKQSTAYQHFLANARDQMSGIGTVSGDFLYSIQTQTAATHQYYVELAQSTLAVKELQTALSETPSDKLINQAESALIVYRDLGDENLSGLRSAIDSAKSKMDSLNSSVQSTLNSLRDQFDEINNNQTAIEQRRYETQVSELQAKLAEAQALQDAKAIADLKEALSLAQQIHDQKMATIKAEQAASKQSSSSSNNSSSSASSSASTTPATKEITIKLAGKTATVKADAANEAALDAIISQLEAASALTSS